MNARNIAIAVVLAGALTVALIGRSSDEKKSGNPAAPAEKTAHKRLSEKTPLPELVEALKSPDYGILAAVLLGGRDPETVIPPLLSALKDDNTQMRSHAAMALGILNETITTPELVNMRDAIVIPALIAAAKDSNADVRFRVVEALGLLGGKSAIPAASEALYDKEDRLRKKAFEALNRLLYRSNGLSPDKEAEAQDQKPAKRKLSGKSSIEELTSALNGPYYGIHAAILLSHQDPKAAIPPLLTALKDDNARTRRHAAMALGLLGNKSAVPALIEAMNDSDAYVRYRVIEALELLGGQSAIPALEEALKYGESWQRNKAAEALTTLRSHPSGEEPAMEARSEPPAAGGVEAGSHAPATKEIGADAPTVEPREAMKDPDRRLSESAVESFGKLDYQSGGNERAVGGEAGVRGEMGDKTAGQELQNALGDWNRKTREKP